MNAVELKHPGINLPHRNPADHVRDEQTVFGFWVFLMSDAVLFAVLFATYASMTYRTADGPDGAALFDLRHTFIETLVLLTSTMTFGMASVAMASDRTREVCLWLAVTLLLGASFLGLEIHELAGMLARDAGPTQSGFLSAFFVLISTHGLHVAAGSIWLTVMFVQIGVFGLQPAVKSRLLRLGLFWHFLDIIWVVIFSVVYLAGVGP